MRLISADFLEGKPIPKKFTCDGENVSPHLRWEDAPKETKSFILILHDPDAPKKDGFTHWVLYDIPASTREIPENASKEQGRIPSLGTQGKNDAGKFGYIGPCPPSGVHRYFLRLYALRRELDLEPGATRAQVNIEMEPYIIEEAETMGTYARAHAKGA